MILHITCKNLHFCPTQMGSACHIFFLHMSLKPTTIALLTPHPLISTLIKSNPFLFDLPLHWLPFTPVIPTLLTISSYKNIILVNSLNLNNLYNNKLYNLPKLEWRLAVLDIFLAYLIWKQLNLNFYQEYHYWKMCSSIVSSKSSYIYFYRSC